MRAKRTTKTPYVRQPSESAIQKVKGKIQPVGPVGDLCMECDCPDVCPATDCVQECPCDCETPGFPDQGWMKIVQGRIEIIDGRIDQLESRLLARFSNIEKILKQILSRLEK